ncbi:DUF7344 domain-containing protein [Natrialbaceae archaeon AArc-T1-2]|uniref:DUF7344 domain-containing protein n=1 Tax=Natrialbaceae archaeon AArc-T1-2 TaxID=3053904 RepID=UPI00255B371D|nr:hypothetical protein [Natrialbaceae archaeon AArc-T1-2]WIV67692.1 hypothetical protein QQ977_02875 [Natrialbaceae archaeon AArc-T1-2]
MRKPERTAARAAAAGALSLDRVFDLLSDRRRRLVLYHLHDCADDTATVDEITAYVASQEESKTSPQEHRQEIVMSLEHVHLPRLEDAAVLEYDRRSETVRYRQQPSLEEWLEHARHKELS